MSYVGVVNPEDQKGKCKSTSVFDEKDTEKEIGFVCPRVFGSLEGDLE